MQLLDVGGQKANYPLEALLLEDCFTQGRQAKLLSLAIPVQTDICSFAQATLQAPAMVYRVQGNDTDAEGFERQLVYFLRRQYDTAIADFQDCLDCLERGEPCYIIIGQAHLLGQSPVLWNMLLALLDASGDEVRFVLVAAQPIDFVTQANGLPLATMQGEAMIAVLDEDTAENYLQRAYPALLTYDRQRIYQISGGWVSAMDRLVDCVGKLHQPQVCIESLFASLGPLLDKRMATWTAQEQEIMMHLCVAEDMPFGLAQSLCHNGVDGIHQLSNQRFLIRRLDSFEPVYQMNPVLQSYLYRQVYLARGKDFLDTQHQLVAAYGESGNQWLMVFRHHLRADNVVEAAKALRYLSFCEIDPGLLEQYCRLLTTFPPDVLDKEPWVQMGYAMAMKYRHPTIAFRFLDRAMELFRQSHELEGLVLAACQKMSVGFFALEQQSTTQAFLEIMSLPKETPFSPMVEGYSAVFTAYATIQSKGDTQKAIALLERAREGAILSGDDNMRLWACFVLLIIYKEGNYDQGVQSVLDEALELVERTTVQQATKMCLYQTVAFLYYIEGGDYAQACILCEKASRIAQQIRATGYQVYINMVHAYALDCLGRFERAQQVIVDTMQVGGNVLNMHNEHLWAYYLIGQAYHYFCRGDVQLAFDTAQRAVGYASRSGRRSYWLRALLLLGNIEISRGNDIQASVHLEQCFEMSKGEKYYFYRLSAQFLSAQIYHFQNNKSGFVASMRRLVEAGKRANVFHYNFSKPSTIYDMLQLYEAPLADGAVYAQLLEKNQLEDSQAPKTVLEVTGAETPLQVGILGPLSLWNNGELQPPCASAKAVQLLRILALSDGAVGVQRLLADIWPDWEEKSAMNNFYFTLHQLRTYMGSKEAVLYKRGDCALNPELVTVDAKVFVERSRIAKQYFTAGNFYAAKEHYSQLYSLVRGEVLCGADLTELAMLPFEALQRTVCTVMREYAITCLQCQQPEEALPVLAVALQNPFADEGLHRLWMAGEYLCGNKSGALDSYQRLEQQLQDDLGVEPHRLSRELVDNIRRNQEIFGWEWA